MRDEILCRTGETIEWNRCFETLLCDELTAETAVYIALLNNRNLQATYERLGIAKAQLVQAGLLRNPVFALSYRFSTRSSVTDLVDLSLLQNTLETLLIPLKKKAARRELETVKWSVAAEILEVIGQTKSAFYSLQASEAIWKLKQQEVRTLECQFEAARRLFEPGNNLELEVTANETLYMQARSELADLEVAILEQREALNRLMGLWGTQIEWCTASNLPEMCPNDWEDIENRAIACSIDLQIARNQICATAASVGIDTARIVFPQMELGAAAEREDSIWYIGPAFALSIPLFDFGQAAAAAGQALIFEQWNRYTAEAVALRSFARATRLHLLNAARQYRYYEERLIPITEQNLSLSLLQHNAMQLGVLALLNAKREEVLAKIASIERLREYWMAYTALETLLMGHRLQ